MVDEPNDDETLFDELLSKRGMEWLKKNLPEILPSLNQSATTAAGTPGLEGFLREMLGKTEKRAETLEAQLLAALEVLTPEQRTLLKSAKSASADGQEKPTTAPAPAPAPTASLTPSLTPENPPKRKFLQRL